MLTLSFWLDSAVALALIIGLGLYLYARASQRAQIFERARREVKRRGAVVEPKTQRQVARFSLRFLRQLGAALPLFSAAQRKEASNKLVMAGYRSPTALLVLAGVTVVSSAGFVLAARLFVWPTLIDNNALIAWLALAISFYLGILLPRLVLDRLVARRQEAIRTSLPDALDLLVISTNAGLGLNPALQRVADEMAFVAPALADEFHLTATELQLSSDTERVLNRLAERVGIESMRSLVSTFSQARQYGTSITQALRILARTERTNRLMSIEEQAAKLSVKMTIPMMLFILPTVIIVGAGPAAINLIQFFAGQ